MYTNASSSHPCEPPVPAMEQGKRRAVGPVTFVSEKQHSLLASRRQDLRTFFLHVSCIPSCPESLGFDRCEILAISMDRHVR